jgi:hypothetical protein
MSSDHADIRALPSPAVIAVLFALLLSISIPAATPAEDVAAPKTDMLELNDAFLPFAAPTAAFESARVVHRVKYNNAWWMRIHVKFRIKNALSTPCKIYAYFYDDTDGEPLAAGDGYAKYATSKGNVYTALDFTPSLNDAAYSDLQLYIPYQALNLETEKGSEYDLKYFFTMRDESANREFAKSGWYLIWRRKAGLDLL